MEDLIETQYDIASERERISQRLRELVRICGRKWSRIAEIMKREGFTEKGQPMTANALRKRYSRISETGDTFGGISVNGSELGHHPATLTDIGRPGSIGGEDPILMKLQQANEELVSLRLRVEQIEQSSGLRQQDLIHSADTGRDSVTVRDLLDLIAKIAPSRETSLQTSPPLSPDGIMEIIGNPLQEEIQGAVDRELKQMLQGEGAKKILSELLDERLKAYLEGISVKGEHSGPGRGRRGKTHKKFSASLPEDLFSEVKSLPGMFSAHLAAALRLYLRTLEGEGKS